MKKLLSIALLSSFHLVAHSQTFMHGAGTGTSLFTSKNIETTIYGSLLYSPRVSLMENENSSVTVGIPLNMGFSGGFGYSSNMGSYDDFQFLIHAPAMVNYNWGAGSSPQSERRLGFFAGAGFGLTFGNHFIEETIWENGWEYWDYSEKTKTYWGPAANAGMRIRVGRQSKNIEVLMSYKMGISSNNPHYFGLSCLFNFK